MSAVLRRRFRAVLLIVAVPALVLHVLGPASAHSAPAAHGESAFEWSCGPLVLDGAVTAPAPSAPPVFPVPPSRVDRLGVVADPPVLSVLCRWRM